MRFGFGSVLVIAVFALCLLFAGCAGSAPNNPPPAVPAQPAPLAPPAPANAAAPSTTELAALPAHVPAHLNTCVYSGIWSGTYGPMNLTQTGSMVAGTGAKATETLKGTVIDGVFVGTWSKPLSFSEPNNTGDLIFYFANDCNSFNGVWNYGQHPSGVAWSGNWDGAKTPASPQPTAPSNTALPTHLANCAYGGAWSSGWGAMNLTQTGSTVNGTYEHDSGRLDGTVMDGVLAGKWSESPSYSGSNDSGDALLYFTDDCNSFSGTWNYGQHPSGATWSGIWVGTKAPASSQPTSYPIDSKVSTTLERTVIPVQVPSTSPKLPPNEISNFSQYGYGVWQFGGGLGFEKRLDLMPSTYNSASVAPAARLLNFFTMTDIHLTDKESPAEMVYYGYKWGVISGYSPAMLYSTHMLDAAVQTANALNKKTPFDFGISLGDDINSGQYNELRWFIDVLDGKSIIPDSGVRNDPVPGPLNDYQDEYKSAGLDKSIPWYQTLGNHDHFWAGMFPPDAYIKNAMTGNASLNMGNVLATDHLGLQSRGFYMGAVDGSTPYGNIIGAGPVSDFSDGAPTVPADPNRRFIPRNEWINEFFNTTSGPAGHGFNQTNVATGFASYSFEPNSNLPIKVIVLDDTQRDDDPNGYAYGRGALDQERYDWLIKELDVGQAEDKLMIISAHVPIGVGDLDSPLGWTSISYISDEKLIDKLHTYPNLILWASGHRHLNTVTALKSPDAARPELGFWEVETASLREFPQQFRTFEIVRNSDNTISIFATDVDPAVKEGSPAALSRSYAIAAHQIFNDPKTNMPSGAYNVELVKQLTPEMQAKIKNYGTPIGK